MVFAFRRNDPVAKYIFDFMSGLLPSGVTLTRASTGWYFDSTGTLQSALTDVARFAYDPVSLTLRGMWNEPAATNVVPRNDGSGASAGSPGTAPTGWTVSTTANNVTRTISALASVDGFQYFRVQFSGTPTGNGTMAVTPMSTTLVDAVAGETWSAAGLVRLQAGSLTNANLFASLNERNSGGTSLASTSLQIIPTSAALRTQRFDIVRLLTNGSTAKVSMSYFFFSYTTGNAVDFTIDMGLATLAKISTGIGSFIPTTGTSVARAADVTTIGGIDAGIYDFDIFRETGRERVLAADVSSGSYVVPTSVYPLRQVRAYRRA